MSYATHIFTVSSPLKTSILVITISVSPLISTAYFPTTRSNQPHLLGLPVVAPYSNPVFLYCSPSSSVSSVTNGPSPTLVVYAFITPIPLVIFLGDIPAPVVTPPVVGDDDVT